MLFARLNFTIDSLFGYLHDRLCHSRAVCCSLPSEKACKAYTGICGLRINSTCSKTVQRPAICRGR